MANLSLTACSFLLRKRHSRGNFLFFRDKIQRENAEEFLEHNVEGIFENFFKTHADSIDDSDKKRTFHCEFIDSNRGETKDYFFIYAIIKSGSYGSASDIIDNDSREIVHRKTANQTEEKPFYLYVIIPKDSMDGSVKVQKGMLFFQNVGQYGVKTVTSNYIKEYFALNYHITFECKTIATKLFVERMIKQENVKQIIMTKNYKSSDFSDNFAKGYGSETKIVGKLTLSEDKWSKIKSKIDFFIQGKFNLFELDGFECDQLKLRVKINNNERTINMGYLENLSLIEAIPDDVQMEDGHPNKERLLQHFEKVAEDYLSEMVLQVENE